MAFALPILHRILVRRERLQEKWEEKVRIARFKAQLAGQDEEEAVVQLQASNPANDTRLKALVLTPTHELAKQVAKHINDVAKFTSIKVGIEFGSR